MLFTGLLNIIPATRRLAPIEDNEKQSNRFKAVGLGLLALINLKEDFRDLMSVFGKTKNELDKEYKAVFKFFAGTPVEAFLMKSETGRNFFHKEDIALADTMFGEKIKDCLGVSEKLKTFPKEIYYPFSKKPEIIKREYVKISGSLFAKVITLSLNRITKLGLIFAVILELPKLIDEITKQNYKQIPKSFLNICCYTVCGALASSIGAYTLGAAGSVLGLGIGYYMGNNISKHVNSKY
jgi:hypothetical protein